MPGIMTIPLEEAMVGRVQGTILLLSIITIGSLEAIPLMTENLEVTILMTEGLEMILLPAAHTIGGLEVVHLMTLRTLMDMEAAIHRKIRTPRTPHLGEAEVEEGAVEVVGVEDTLDLEVVEDLDMVVILEAMEDIIVVVRDRVVQADPLNWLDYLS